MDAACIFISDFTITLFYVLSNDRIRIEMYDCEKKIHIMLGSGGMMVCLI